MSRLAGPRRAGPFTTLTRLWSKREYGRVAEPLEVAAHHPGVLRGWAALEWETSRASTVDQKLKDLAEIKVAALVGCEWCLDIGSSIGVRSGITREQLADLPRYRESPYFTEEERLVIDYAAAMTATPSTVPDELFEALRARLSEPQLVELTSAIAVENYRARFNWAFGIEPQGFCADGTCALPERAASQAPGVTAGSA